MLYGGKHLMKLARTELRLHWLDGIERHAQRRRRMWDSMPPVPCTELVESLRGHLPWGAKMGEGWLLTAEMIELVQGGYSNIVCAQPFGCLPNHIVGQRHGE